VARLYHYSQSELLGTVELTEYDVIVGRQQDCDLILESPSSSRQHLRFSPNKDGGWLMVDLGSENGTQVDGIREYRKVLQDRAVIQVGNEMLVYEPFGDTTSGSGRKSPSLRPLPKPVSQARFKELQKGEITQHVAPAIHRRAAADARGRLRPHLVLETHEGDKVFPLDAVVTPIGYGKLKVSVGSPVRGKTVVLAQVIRGKNDSWSVQAKGLFARIQVRGKGVAKMDLNPGDSFVIDEHTIRFELGINEMAWDH
jgi:FHA domain